MAYTDKSKLRVVYGDYTLGVHGKEFNYIFSYAQGGLESIVKNGYEWLYRCPKPTFWRALTDNDRGSKFHIKSGSWLSADMFIDCKDVQVFMDGEVQKIYAPDNNSYEGDVSADEIRVQYTYETINTPSTTVVVTYTVNITGKIQVNVKAIDSTAFTLDQISVARDIAGLNYYFKDDNIIVEWTDVNCGNVVINVSNTQNSQILDKQTD